MALSSEAAETAELAAGHVPTVSDRYSSPYETVEYAARLVSSAREVLTRAVVHAREIGGSWEEIGEALAITADEAQERYREALGRWEDALDRPWEQSGPFRSSRMPSGCSDPDFTIHYLDGWCLKHLEPSSGARSNAKHDGIEDRMVSANLPAHTEITEWNSVLRTARHLIDIGAKPDSPEWTAYEARKAAVVARQQERSR